MSATIRLANVGDAEPILKVYAPIVRDTPISFELEPPTIDDMRRRIAVTLAHWPWLVCERDDEVLGYAYASKHRERAAYQWSVDVSAYVHPQVYRSGIGRALYASLFKLLVLQHFYNAYAGIALPNPASVGLHEAMGFRPVGIYRAVGYKLGKWHDVGWWQLELQPRPVSPQPPVALSEVHASEMWDAALATGLSFLRI